MQIAISKLHLEPFDDNRRDLLERLAPHTGGYILGGGTALAFQINHRKSFDFDFFSREEIPRTLLVKLSRTIPPSTVSKDTSDELTFFDRQEIKVSFIYYPFKPLFEPLETDWGLKLYGVDDLAVQKAYTIGRRGEYRDYFDLYTLLSTRRTTLIKIIENASKVYGEVFNPKIFFEQLVYFEDLRDFKIIPISDTAMVADPNEIKLFLEQAVSEYLKR